jgi:hypothetical protein
LRITVLGTPCKKESGVMEMYGREWKKDVYQVEEGRLDIKARMK